MFCFVFDSLELKRRDETFLKKNFAQDEKPYWLITGEMIFDLKGQLMTNS